MTKTPDLIKNSAKRLPCGRMIPPTPIGHGSPKSHWKAQLEEYVISQGLRRSDQRWKIAEAILSVAEHLSAQEIVSLIQKKHPGIGAATVYRNIKVLCDALILKESLTDARGHVVYEIFDKAHHDHIVCLDCGEIFEFHDNEIERLQEKIIRKQNFDEVRHRHVVYANCSLKSGS